MIAVECGFRGDACDVGVEHGFEERGGGAWVLEVLVHDGAHAAEEHGAGIGDGDDGVVEAVVALAGVI